MTENEAWVRAIDLIPYYGALLEVAIIDGCWRGRYSREDYLPRWQYVGIAP
jgi:hypothetical protein